MIYMYWWKLVLNELHIYLDRISAFQGDEFVRQALENGMDLREYALQIEQERESVQRDLENDCKYFKMYNSIVWICVFYVDVHWETLCIFLKDVQQIQSFVDLHSEIQVQPPNTNRNRVIVYLDRQNIYIYIYIYIYTIYSKKIVIFFSYHIELWWSTWKDGRVTKCFSKWFG